MKHLVTDVTAFSVSQSTGASMKEILERYCDISVLGKRINLWAQVSFAPTDISGHASIQREYPLIRFKEWLRIVTGSDLKSSLSALITWRSWINPNRAVLITQFGHLMRMPPGCLSLEAPRHVQSGGNPGDDLEFDRGIKYLNLAMNTLRSQRRSEKVLLVRRVTGIRCLACCHCDPIPDKPNWTNGGMFLSNHCPFLIEKWFQEHSKVFCLAL